MVETRSTAQSKASRKNGSKSKGPKSTEGKARSAQNATKDGVFSRTIVIPQLDESEEQFAFVKEAFWKLLEPSGVLEESLVSDFVENWWRRERIRRAEQLELASRLAGFELRRAMAARAKVEILKTRFFVLCERLLPGISDDFSDRQKTIAELEEVTRELRSDFLGLEFLHGQLVKLFKQIEEQKSVTPLASIRLRACFGFGSSETELSLPSISILTTKAEGLPTQQSSSQSKSPTAVEKRKQEKEEEELRLALRLQELSKTYRTADEGGKESTSAERRGAGTKAVDAEPPKSSNEPPREEKTSSSQREGAIVIVREAILGARTMLYLQLKWLASLRQNEFNIEQSQAILEPQSSERFSRAETTVERRMYRALAALLTLRGDDQPRLLPPMKLGPKG